MFLILDLKEQGKAVAYISIKIYHIKWEDLKLSESVFIEVSKNIFKKNRNIILGVIYHSPDSQLSIFNESLEKVLIQSDNEKSIAYLSGDFNVNTADVLNCKTQTIHDLINIYSLFYYHKLINQPTRIILQKNSIKTATLIDNIYRTHSDFSIKKCHYVEEIIYEEKLGTYGRSLLDGGPCYEH